MKVRAVHRNARMAPRKMRPLARMIRGLPAKDAMSQLMFLPGKGPEIILAVLRSAMANAQHNHDMQEDTLRIADITIDEGLVMKRYQPVAKGMAHPILKRTSHVTVVVDGQAAAKKVKAKKKKADIATISADEYTEQQTKEAIKEEKQELTATTATKKEAGEERTIETLQDKKEEAFQKKKMVQQGGDKKKTHRRKSIG